MTFQCIHAIVNYNLVRRGRLNTQTFHYISENFHQPDSQVAGLNGMRGCSRALMHVITRWLSRRVLPFYTLRKPGFFFSHVAGSGFG